MKLPRPKRNEQQLALGFEEPAPPAKHAQAPVADAQQRRDALDPTRSFIVQAPAGSGKTELLIQRFLVLLSRAGRPEEVVAITFTRKAAGEMRSRILEALREARQGLEPESAHHALTLGLAGAVLERDASEGWGLESNPNRLQLQTIDSLCIGVTSQMPLLSRLGPALRLQEDAFDLYRTAARETLALLEDDGYTQQVAALLKHLDNDVAAAERLLAGLLGKRDQWWRHLNSGSARRAELEQALANLNRERMQQARDAAPEVFIDSILTSVRYAAANIVQAHPASPLVACSEVTALPGAQLADVALWRGIAELFLTGAGTLRRRLDRRSGFLPANEVAGTEREQRRRAKEQAEELLENLVAHQDFVQALQEIRLLPPVTYAQGQWAFIEALSALLPIAVAQLELSFRRYGAVDFVATTLGAIRALGEADAPTDLALTLDYRIQHLLVDEFQDTSLSQFELLLRLTAGWQRGDGRTLFLVGDPMQSIYRFREAEVGLFLRAWHGGLGGVPLEPLALSVNFRAQAGLVEWVNEVFAQVLPAREDLASGAVPFTASTAREAAVPGPAVCIHAFVPAQRAAEAQRVLEIIRQFREEEPEGSVAVLVRSRSQLHEIVPRLKEAGIRYRAIEIEPLTGRAAVRDLYALTRALLHPADRTAWLAVLRAPWCGLTLADLERVVGDERAGVLWSRLIDPDVRSTLGPDARQRVEQLVAALEPALANRGRGSLRGRVEAAWLRLAGPACAEEVTDVEDALVFLALLEEIEQGAEVEDFAALAERLAGLYAQPDVHAPETLQVMTIHKSKGLEFDTVIVPGLGSGTRRDEAQLLQWLERPNAAGGSDLLLAAMTEQGREEDPVYSCLRRLHNERQRQEDGRLLYVAVTRARRRVHLLGHAELDETTGEANAPDRNSLLARLWPAAAPQFHAVARRLAQHRPDQQQAAPPPASSLQRVRRLAPGWRAPGVPPAVRWAVPPPAAAREQRTGVEFDWAGETARHVGTVVHRYLQRIGEEGIAGWDAARVHALQPVLRAALRGEGVPAAELDWAAARVGEALCGVLADDRGRWILDANHAQAACELRLSAQLEGEIVNVALDRTFVDGQGIRWIVDYKTGAHEGGALETFLDREQERYREQLERYAKIMTALDQRPVRVALYFPLLQAWREWEVGQKT